MHAKLTYILIVGGNRTGKQEMHFTNMADDKGKDNKKSPYRS